MVLDHRFQISMAVKAQSSNPREAEIGRQGQALRASCITSSFRGSNIASSADTNVSSLCLFGSSLKRHSTDITIPDTKEEMEKILQLLPRWDPGSFDRDPRSKTTRTYDNTLGAKAMRRYLPQPDPIKRELSNHEMQSRLWGGNFWIDGPKSVEAIPSWNERPLEEQKKLLRELREPNLFFHYPHWTKLEYKGLGKYRMSVDITPDDAVRGLIDRMGPTADLLGMSRGLPFEGHDGIEIEELLYIKYEDEIKQKFRRPTEEMVGDTKVIRGFPVPLDRRGKAVETFLLPLTYANFEFQPYDTISAHFIVHNYHLKGKDCDQKAPNENDLDLVDAFPEHLKNQANHPIPKGFTLNGQPSHASISCQRHPGIIHSDLELLPKHPTITPRHYPSTQALAAAGRLPAVGTTRRGPAAGRPGLERRTSDGGPRTKKTKASALGKRRVTSAVQLSQYKEEGKLSNSQAVAPPQEYGTVAQVPNVVIPNMEALAIEVPQNEAIENEAAWMDAPGSVIPSPSNQENLDSPPPWLLATSSKGNEARSRGLRPKSAMPRRPSAKSSKQLLAILSKSPALTVDSTQLSLKSTSLVPVLTPAAPEIAAIPINRPTTPRNSVSRCASVSKPSHTLPIAISQPFTPEMSRSPSVSKRNNTLSDRSKRRVRWQSKLVHTSEEGGCQRHSIYNYSNSSSPQYIRAEPAAKRQAVSTTRIPRTSGICTARPARTDRQFVTPIANSFALNRERLSRNGHSRKSPVTQMANSLALNRERLSRNSYGRQLPAFPNVPTEDLCVVVDDDETAVEDDGEEWEELDLPESPSPTFMPTLQHRLSVA